MTTILLNIPINWSDPALYMLLLILAAMTAIFVICLFYAVRAIRKSLKNDKKVSEEASLEFNFLHRQIALRIKVLDVVWQGELYGYMLEQFLLRYEGGLILGQGKANFDSLTKMIDKDITVRVSAIYGHNDSRLDSVIGATAQLKTWSKNTMPGPGEVSPPIIAEAIPT